ncbi:YraN family protein [Verrucomicrobiota bacterium]
MRLLKKIKPQPEHLKTGIWGEKVAARFLRKEGFRVVARRVKVGRDEIDLIARRKEQLIIVEVKTRRSEKFGRPASAINKRKRLALQRATIRYLNKLHRPPRYVRIDCIEVIGQRGDRHPAIRHLENILTLDRYQLPRK